MCAEQGGGGGRGGSIVQMKGNKRSLWLNVDKHTRARARARTFSHTHRAARGVGASVAVKKESYPSSPCRKREVVAPCSNAPPEARLRHLRSLSTTTEME